MYVKMLKNITKSFALIFILASCESTAPITDSMTYEELELDASTMTTKLDINIVERQCENYSFFVSSILP